MARESIRGLIAARKAFQALPETVRDAMLDVVEDTAEQVRAGAVARVPVRYGFLSKHIAKTISKRSGFAAVGISKGTETAPTGETVEPWRYAHLVEFGTTRIHARSFMLSSAQAEEQQFVQRAIRSGARIERDIAAIGARFE